MSVVKRGLSDSDAFLSKRGRMGAVA